MPKYVYESTQQGLFSFTVPGEERTVQLVMGSKITLTKQLAGGYTRVLRLIKTIEDPVEPTAAPVQTQAPAPTAAPETKIVEAVKPIAKVVDRITKVVGKVDVKTEDTVTNIKEAEAIKAVDDVIKKEVIESSQMGKAVAASSRRTVRRK